MKRTAAQLAAIESTSPRILVLAGPGSGKTSTVVGRLERLIERGVSPRKIAAITFTNAAARELESRITEPARDGAVSGVKPRNRPTSLGYCGTLHGFALRCLKLHGGAEGYGDRISVINPEGAEALLESANRTIANSKISMKKILETKASGIPERPSTTPELVVAHYFGLIRSAGIVDFDVILTEFARCLRDSPRFGLEIAEEFEHVFVDEVQDSSPVDWAIYRSLAIRNKFLVGDPDQSIYGFRGAALAETFETATDPDWEKILLEENFRSFNAITGAAQRLIERNAGCVPKETISAVGVGGRVAVLEAANAGEEIARLAALIRMDLVGRKPEELAVLVRTNAAALEISKGLAAEKIPVALRTNPDLPKDLPILRALASYLCNPENDTLGFLYLVADPSATSAPPDLDRKKAIERAHAFARNASEARKSINSFLFGFPKEIPASEFPTIVAKHRLSHESRMFVAEKLRELPDGAPMVELAHALGSGEEFDAARALSAEGVRVTTIHSAKGLEFDTVYLAAFEDETIPGRRKDVDVEEERRLAYVGITRAKRVLQFTSARIRETKWKGLEPRSPSRFIEEATK